MCCVREEAKAEALKMEERGQADAKAGALKMEERVAVPVVFFSTHLFCWRKREGGYVAANVWPRSTDGMGDGYFDRDADAEGRPVGQLPGMGTGVRDCWTQYTTVVLHYHTFLHLGRGSQHPVGAMEFYTLSTAVRNMWTR